MLRCCARSCALSKQLFTKIGRKIKKILRNGFTSHSNVTELSTHTSTTLRSWEHKLMWKRSFSNLTDILFFKFWVHSSTFFAAHDIYFNETFTFCFIWFGLGMNRFHKYLSRKSDMYSYIYPSWNYFTNIQISMSCIFGRVQNVLW